MAPIDILIYLLLGTIDVFLILAFIFKTFKWPFFRYVRECLTIASICSLESYVNRIILNIPQWDVLIQIVSLMIMLHVIIKVNWYHSLTLSAYGAIAYSIIVYLTYMLLGVSGLVTHEDMAASNGTGIFTIQISSESIGAVMAWMIHELNLGFSFIPAPPGERKIMFSPTEKLLLAVHLTAVLIVITTMFWIINYGGFGISVIMVSEVIMLIILLLIARKQDYNR